MKQGQKTQFKAKTTPKINSGKPEKLYPLSPSDPLFSIFVMDIACTSKCDGRTGGVMRMMEVILKNYSKPEEKKQHLSFPVGLESFLLGAPERIIGFLTQCQESVRR